MAKESLKEFYASGEEYEALGPAFKLKSKTYLDKVKSYLLNIFLDNNQISEKAYTAIDNAKLKFDNWCNNHIGELTLVVSKFEKLGLRIEFCGEYCFNKFFKDNNLSIGNSNQLLEKRKSSFEILKKNKIPLTNEERSEIIKSKAVWGDSSNGNKPSPAVWKSKNSKGEIVYVTNTHRAYNKAKTLKGAISRFHNFIKGTS